MAGKRVLIVDDDKEFVKLYSLFLKNKGLQVSAVYSAGEALSALEELLGALPALRQAADALAAASYAAAPPRADEVEPLLDLAETAAAGLAAPQAYVEAVLSP